MTRAALRSAAALAGVHTLAHFVPFERSGLAPDDYAFYAGVSSASGGAAASGWAVDRPLTALARTALAAIVGVDGRGQVVVVWAASLLLAMAVLVLLFELLQDLRLSLLAALLWTLLPAHSEVHHYLLHAHISLCWATYALAAAGFLRFLRTGSRVALGGSLLAYTVGAFWYEVGLLLPVALLLLAVRTRRRDAVIAALAYAVPALLYLGWRVAAAALAGSGDEASTRVPALAGFLPNLLGAVPSHYLGRYAARGYVYGLGGVTRMPWPWIALIAAADGALVVAAAVWLRRPLARPKPGALFDAGVIGVSFVLPACFWMVESRHTVLTSVGVAVLLLPAARALARGRRPWLPLVFGAAVLSAQGAAWNQVIAARFSAAMFQALRADSAALQRADTAILDARSLADRIPYTWGETEHNVLHYYWGQQVLHSGGFDGMVRLAAPGHRPRTLVAITRPVLQAGALRFGSEDPVHPRRQRVPMAETVAPANAYVLDHDRVFGRR